MTSHTVLPLSSLIQWTHNLHSCSLPKQHSVRFAIKLFCGQKYGNTEIRKPKCAKFVSWRQETRKPVELAQTCAVFCNKARTVLFWVITQHVLAITDRRFETTYRSHIRGSRIQEPTITTPSVMTQKSAVLSLSASRRKPDISRQKQWAQLQSLTPN